MDSLFPTYGAPLLNLYNNKMTNYGDDDTNFSKYGMPTIDIADLNGTTGRGDIMQNFLYAAPNRHGGTTPDGSTIKNMPSAWVGKPGVLDLASIYQSRDDEDPDHDGGKQIALFANHFEDAPMQDSN
jgi:hypothetical protein